MNNELIVNIITVVVSSIILPLITHLTSKLINYLKNKSEIESLNKNLSLLNTIVKSSVETISQTFVKQLKEDNKFDKENQLIAFDKAKTLIDNQINDKLKKFIVDNYSNYDTWIKNQIESTVINNK